MYIAQSVFTNGYLSDHWTLFRGSCIFHRKFDEIWDGIPSLPFQAQWCQHDIINTSRRKFTFNSWATINRQAFAKPSKPCISCICKMCRFMSCFCQLICLKDPLSLIHRTAPKRATFNRKLCRYIFAFIMTTASETTSVPLCMGLYQTHTQTHTQFQTYMNDEVVAAHSSFVVKFPFIFIWFGIRFERPIYTYTFVWIRNIKFHKNWWPSSGKIPRIQFVPHWNSCCLQNHVSTGLNENEEWKTDEMKTILWTVKRQQNGLNVRHTPYWWITVNCKSHRKFISKILENIWSTHISRTFSNGNENKNK